MDEKITAIKVGENVRQQIQLLKQRKGLKNVDETILYLFQIGSKRDGDIMASMPLNSKPIIAKPKEERKKQARKEYEKIQEQALEEFKKKVKEIEEEK